MAKKKKKKIVDPELQASIKAAAQRIIQDLDGRTPAERWADARMESAGHELELIEAIAEHKNLEALIFLHRIAPTLPEKSVNKAVKKAIYRLEQKGLVIPDEYRISASPLIKPPAEKEPRGFVGTYDPQGVRACLLALPTASTGYDTALFLADHYGGLLDFSVYRFSLGEINNNIKKIREEEGLALLEVPPAAVGFVLTEAVARARATGRPVTEEYDGFLHRARSIPTLDRPLIYDLIPAPTERSSDQLRDDIRELASHAFMAGMILTEDLRPYIGKLQGVEETVLILTEDQKDERRLAIMIEAAEAIFGPERRVVLKRQLEEVALLLWEDGKPVLADTALAAAMDLEREPGPLKPHIMPLELVAFSLEKLTQFLTDHLDSPSEREEEHSSESLLVLPGRDF